MLVNLEKHAVLEASAGTGKTYTLEELVLRLLIEKGCRLDQILLVTYTEKATGELKGRLRDRLEKTLRVELADESTRRLLRAALDQFDQTSIFTIHGFCQRVLQEFAFEQRQDFRPRLVHDRPLLKTCLRELQRRDWWQRYGKHLRNILEMANFQGKAGEKWERLVLSVAECMRPMCGHRLNPEPCADWTEQLPILEADIRERVHWLRENAGGIREPIHNHPWFTGYSQIRHRYRITKRDQIIVPLLHWLASRDADERPLSFIRLAHVSIDAKRSFAWPLEGLSAEDRAVLDQHCPGLPLALEIAEKLRERTNCAALADQLAAHTIMQLQKHLGDLKRERGLQSFEDMIVRVHEGLDPQQNASAHTLAMQLRERYRYAIVDEFQDTDPLQWQIFRRIFVDGDSNRLYVVGDPKQAIFAFRGADLPTYLTAVNELKSSYMAATHELATNWRSTGEMLHALNQLFDRGDWFADSALKYTRVSAPPDEKRQIEVVRDDSLRPALSVVEVTARKLSQARRCFAQFVAAEICRLLNGQAALEYLHRGQRRTLTASDFCVLVWKRSEAEPVVDAFKNAGIPFSFYKQTGLWQSEQAVHLGYVLRALARPNDTEAFHKALLSRFFRFRPEQLAGVSGWLVHHAAGELFQHWVHLAERRQWGRLLQSLLEDSGLIYCEAQLPDGERRLANYRHIFAVLEQAAYSQNLDLFELLEVFEQKCRQIDEEAELQPIETDQPKVRIMTIHAAKGLEFPIVFLAGGFTQRPTAGDVFRDPNGNVVYMLSATEESRIGARHERLAEDRRLLYVALTRAMIKLYVPCPIVERASAPGPILSILQPALTKSEAEQLGTPWAEKFACDAAASKLMKVTAAPQAPSALADDLFPQVDAELWRRRILIRSFSSLHREKSRHVAEAPTFGDDSKREVDDEPSTPQAADSLRGPVFGDIVHNIIEQFDFALAASAEDASVLVRPGHPFRVLVDDELRKNVLNLPSRISRTALDEACRLLVADMVWKTLRTPLHALGCRLCDVPKKDLLREVEFHFPEAFGAELPPAVRREEGFLTGFMDLVVRRGDRYFLFDWKTNLLPGYTAADVAASMREADYIRQYRLYAYALRRWLAVVQPDCNFERDFGGVYYLYLRGLTGIDESSGVYFCRPANGELSLEVILG